MTHIYICRRCGDRRLPPPHDWAGEGDRFPGAAEPHPGGLGGCGDLHDWVPAGNRAIEAAIRQGRAIVVTRHAGAIEWLAAHLGGTYDAAASEIVTAAGRVPVRPAVGVEDVRGRVVLGNLPLHLAQYAAEVWAIEFSGAAPRGAEYTAADMEAAGARLAWYVVLGGGLPLGIGELDAVLSARAAAMSGVPAAEEARP